MILQLNPAIPMYHKDKGNFLAHFLIDYGQESYVYFCGFVESTGEIWTFSNRELRAQKNVTLGRNLEERI